MTGTPGGGGAALLSLCPFCQTPVGAGADEISCPSCGARHHADCWRENAGCGVYGCHEVPAVEARRPVEVPVAYWGQEHKLCPKCGEQIMAIALRCRHCGAVFDGAQPQSADEASRREAAKSRGPSLRRGAVWLFVLCVVPVTAPLGAALGLWWYPRRREALRTQPVLYSALCQLALGIGIGQTAFGAVMACLFMVFRSTP